MYKRVYVQMYILLRFIIVCVNERKYFLKRSQQLMQQFPIYVCLTVMHLQMWTNLEDSINERILKLRSLKRTGYKFLN